MALVCDIKSNSTQEEESENKKQEEIDLEDGEIEDDDDEETATPNEEVALPEPPKPEMPTLPPPVIEKIKTPVETEKNGRERNRDRSDRPERRRHDEKGKKHMTEAEKSILHLRKREESQRKKWEKLNRIKDITPEPDDFAKNIEKTLATILNKKEKEAAAISGGEEKNKEKVEERRGRKRRKHEKDRKDKHRRLDSPRSEIDENEMLNIRGGSPDRRFFEDKNQPSPAFNSEESLDSEYSSDRSKTDDRIRRNKDFRKGGRKNKDRNHHGRNKKRDREREQKNNEQQEQLKDSQGVCVFFLQGKCLKTDCQFSHEAVPPMKLELCKFYLMDCCAKGDKCSYMHSEFPCKFYHAGLNCAQGENCKFAHGKPLSDGLKQTLFKHIETAPRDLLGGFPRMSREEALNLINQTQIKLQEQHGMVHEDKKEESKGGIPSLFDINVPIPPELLQGHDGKLDKSNRHRPSRWQDADIQSGNEAPFPLKPYNYGQDLDMRINSNGDVDMRTLPPALSTPVMLSTIASNNPVENSEADISRYQRESGILGPLLGSNFDFPGSKTLPYSTQDVDIRSQPLLSDTKDVDIRQLPNSFGNNAPQTSFSNEEDEPMLQIDSGDDRRDNQTDLPAHLPKTQRDLFMRIQAHQKESVVELEKKDDFNISENINWYSDDDDDDENRLTIKVDNEDVKEKEEQPENSSLGTTNFASLMSPPTIKPLEVVEKLGDLSKIDISAEVTKLLTSMSQARNNILQSVTAPENKSPPPLVGPNSTPPPASNDPRVPRQDPRKPVEKADQVRYDPRLQQTGTKSRSRQGSIENSKSEKVSIYEQGSIDRNSGAETDIDIRGMRSDVDLRNLQLPFKGMQNYTPCSEIDASVNSHLPISWKVITVDVPRPDYTGLKLSVSDAEKTGDPRLRKIFRLSTEERDTPLSPKASPKASSTVRVDPRLKKMDDNKPEIPGAPMNYTQQLTMLQSSAFYLGLTSNQKLLLNQELSQRNDSNAYDPVLHTLLSNLNIIPTTTPSSSINMGVVQSILSNISKLNPMMGQQGQQPNMPVNPAILGQMAQSISQPGLLGAAPGVPNLPPDFPINFDPRNGGLLGNAPPIPPFGGFPPENQGNFNNYNDEYYPPEGGNMGNFQGNNRDNRGFNRDRRRGRNFSGNRGNRNFRNHRNNRMNRHHSPP